MAWKLQRKALDNAKSKIKAGTVTDAAWDASAAREKLGEAGMNTFALWHLAVDSEADPDTKGAYGYPYGDGEKVYKRAIAAIKSRAAQNDESEIADAANELWDLLTATEKEADGGIMYKSLAQTAVPNEDEGRRVVTVVASTNEEDRQGDVIHPEGINFQAYMKNPVVLARHGFTSDYPVIGKTNKLWTVPGKLMAELEFLPPGTSKLADSIWQVAKFLGTVAVSVGLVPKRYSQRVPSTGGFGLEITESELVELSVVPVPANGSAVGMVRREAGDQLQQVAQLTAQLELAQELVAELAALVTALSDSKEKGLHPKDTSPKIILRRA